MPSTETLQADLALVSSSDPLVNKHVIWRGNFGAHVSAKLTINNSLGDEKLLTQEEAFALGEFCGCGTTIDASEKLGREWVGTGVTQLAISLIKNRLQETYGSRLKFISGSSRREEAQTSPPEQRQSLVTSAATGEKVSIVHIIGGPTM